MLTSKPLIAVAGLGIGPAPDNNCALCVNGPGTSNEVVYSCSIPQLGSQGCLGGKKASVLPGMVL